MTIAVTHHAEMNAIREAERTLGTYDLSRYNLSLYVTAEPCVMCMGGIMWSGIKVVGGIAVELGEEVLREYVSACHTIYKPDRGR